MTQGTIKDYDTADGSGTLLTDDRVEVAIDRRSIEGSNIRMLRIGQRVRFEAVDEDGRSVARELRLVTFE
jgi:cold shock CspA family protein